METINKFEILQHIRLGTKEVLYYPYNEGKDPLPLRPISSYEMDQCFYNSLEFTTEKIAHYVVNLRLNLIEGKERIKLSNKGYSELIKFYDRVNYWVVYFSMKDFQNKEFSKPNFDKIDNFPKGFYIVREMNEVHKIANFVIHASNGGKTVIKEIFKDELGKELAYNIFYLNQELAPLDKITKLQKEFLVYSKGNIKRVLAGDIAKERLSISGEKMTVQDLINKFGVEVK